MDRIIDIEYNDFPLLPIGNLSNGTTNTYRTDIDIHLVNLVAKYKIEEFDDYSLPTPHCEYPALRYLIPNIDKFKFNGGQPGKSKDSRRENSRVLGQTLCRYFINDYLEAPYVANISDFLNKQLDSNFNNVKIERKLKGDTPDYIFANSSQEIFLAEAKGRRTLVQFGDNIFEKWRKQFGRISVKSNGNEVSLKGYIFALCIANQNNKISNSKILVEDPRTSGEPLVEDRDLFNLVKCGHYKNILQKIGLKFIGDSLIYKDKLNEDRFRFSVFTSKISKKEYIGRFSGEIFDEDYFRISRTNYYQILKANSSFFYGVERNVFERLMKIARGNFENIDGLELYEVDRYFNESSIEFKDGAIFSDPYLISYKGWDIF